MTYAAPTITAAGLIIPTYSEIEDYLVAQAQAIFGSDIYLASDSQDFQLIAAQAQAIYDSYLSAQLAYQNRSPISAIGTGLDAIVALNGLQRIAETFSTATVSIVGDAFTEITNGVISDISGNLWDLPASVILDSGGLASVTATAQVSGPTIALTGQINVIITPTLGWTSVTNAAAATPGEPEETDALLRARQATSVSNPSQALTTGILGAVLEVANVASAQIYENDTSSIATTINDVGNPYGYPAHSITMVVDGGVNEEIASAIALRKTPGAYSSGDVEVTVLDRFSVPTTIRFYRPIVTNIEASITITPLTGYTTTLGTQVKQAITDYINSLAAGQSVIISELWQAALSADTQTYPAFSLNIIMANVTGNSPDTADLVMDFEEKPEILLADVTLILNV